MKREIIGVLMLIIGLCGYCNSINSVSVKQIKLKNGLTVWLNQDKSQSMVYGAVVVKAGAKDCPNTGIAHYFEHIMFKGTDKIGSIDYAKEKVYLDSIEDAYNVLGKTTDVIERKQIQKRINELSIKAGEYALPNEFQQLISTYGGSELNAGTSFDYTVFYNTFTPIYLKEWSELNSERLLNPVFRLFQSELETVYEEKNMGDDNMFGGVMDHTLSAVFGNYPYGYPIIGSTENLKNPSLTAMREFYKKYYVANNMALILCGDFEMDNIEEILENSFGRIKSGKVPERQNGQFMPFTENKKVNIKIPVPILKGEALVYYGVPQFDKDAFTLDLAMKILSNDSKTGYLDSLTNNNKLMFTGASRLSFNDAGVVALMYAPNIPFGSIGKARDKVLKEVSRLKAGDFTDKMLYNLKTHSLIEVKSALEKIDTRAQLMMGVYSSGLDWDTYLSKVDEISSITRDDIVRVANKYLSGNYLTLDKRYGRYPKDKVEKPGYSPVIPKHVNEESEYAKNMVKNYVENYTPRFIDINKDAKCVAVTPLVKLYSKHNDVNDLFTLKLRYKKGELADNRLEQLATLLNTACTESTTKQEWNEKLEELGCNLSIDADKRYFKVNLSGIDKNFIASLKLLNDFLEHAKLNEDDLDDQVKENKISVESIKEDKDQLLSALLAKVIYGDLSPYLNSLTKKEMNKLTVENLSLLFKDIQKVECNVLYCGGENEDSIAEILKKELPFSKVEERETLLCTKPLEKIEPIVYFYNLPKARQSCIATYQSFGALTNLKDKTILNLWGDYVGSGFSSLLFQEIREFRSYAYSASGQAIITPLLFPDNTSAYVSVLSTQTDKTLQALQVLDSIYVSMPTKLKNFRVIKQEAINDVYNSYPPMRDIPSMVATLKDKGYSVNPDEETVEMLKSLTYSDIEDFYKNKVRSGKRVTLIVGNKKEIPFKELEKYGKVVELKFNDIIKY